VNGRLVGVLGLARSGRAAAKLALARGERVYASDAADSTELRAAADEIRAAGATVQLGGHAIDQLAACALIILSPGIPPDAPVLREPRVRAVPLVSEVEYAFRHLAAPVIAVTGTNGKSTTTALAAHLLREAGLDAPAAGNIGLALSEVALRADPPDWVVVEVSSFQLARIDTFAPRIGVVTNLAPDHLDRYPSVAAYYADKANLFRNAQPGSVWVLNAEDEAVLALPGDAAGERTFFRTDRPLGTRERGGFLSADGTLVLRAARGDAALARTAELRLLGAHNHANALAAAVAASAAGAGVPALGAGLRSFAGLEHRLEPVVERGGVLWINDSKATNVASARVALRSMTRPAIVLLGGRHKGESYGPLLPELRRHARLVLAYGEAAERIEADLAEQVPVERVPGTFDDVVARAAERAAYGDVVLLAPACASYDMFRDYEERGRRFKELAAGRAEVTHG
jgi:UDP-N-acetylmuramoylalanine--D-glutamate ligase